MEPRELSASRTARARRGRVQRALHRAPAVSPAFEANIPSAGAQSIRAPIIEAANEPPAAALLPLLLPQPEVKLEQAQPAAAALSPVAEPSPPARVISWTALGAALWLTGSVLWFSLAATRLYRFRQLLRRAEPGPVQLQARVRRLSCRMGLAYPPHVLILSAAVSPMLWAVGGAPRLLLPASLLHRLNEEQWDTLLAHELAHLRRRDHWIRMLELLVLGLYWWHPVAWWARRALREAEEQCCDAWVVWALPGSAEAYALALVETVTFLSQSRSALPVAASGIGQVNLLKRRLIMFMCGSTPRALSGLGFLALVALGALLLPLLPTWAQTEQPQLNGDEPASAAPAQESGDPSQDGRPKPAPGEAASPDVSYQPVSSPMTADAARRARYQASSAEQLEDARDEVELLAVQLQGKRAELREVQALLKQASRNGERLRRLGQAGAVDSSEADHARTEVEVLEARLGAKEAQIREAELRLKQAQRRFARLQRTERPRRETQRGGAAPDMGPAGGQGRSGFGDHFGPERTPAEGQGARGWGRFSQGRTPAAGGFVPAGPQSEAGVARPGEAGSQPPATAYGGTMRAPGRGGMMGTGSVGMMGGTGGDMKAGGGGQGMMGQPMMAGTGGPGMGSMTMGGGGSGDQNRRLDDMEKRLNALIKDVRSLKDLANAQSKQDALLHELVDELKQLRQKTEQREKKPRD